MFSAKRLMSKSVGSLILTSAGLTSVGLAAVGMMACSSSSSTNVVTPDSGGGGDANVGDGNTPIKDSGKKDTGTKDSGTKDSGEKDTGADTAKPTPDSGPSGGGGEEASTEGGQGDGGEPSEAATDAGAPVGPGAAFLCTSSGKNAWQTYGASAFVAVNESIFTLVTGLEGTDAGAQGLGTSFQDIGTGSIDGGSVPALDDNLANFKGHLAAYLVFAYGGPTSITYTDNKVYSGITDLVADHRGLNITPDQYEYFISNAVVPALTSNGVPDGDVSSCFAPLVTSTTFMQQIVGNGAAAGSDLKCHSSGRNAYDTYGAAALVAVNEAIFTGVTQAEGTDAGAAGLGPTFDSVGTGKLNDASVPALDDNVANFKGHLAAFLVWSLGGPPVITYTDGKVYNGVQALTPEHTGLGITEDQFTYFLTEVVVPAATSSGVTTEDLGTCLAPVVEDPNFAAQIIGH